MKNLSIKNWKLTLAGYISVIVVFLAPLWLGVHQWYPQNTPKVSLITLGTVLVSLLYGWFIVSDKRDDNPVIRITWIHVALLIFLGVLIISGLLGLDPLASFFGSFARSTSITFFVTLSLFAIVVSELIRRDDSLLKKLLTGLFLASVVNALFTYIGITGLYYIKLWNVSENGASLFLGNSSFLGSLLVSGLFAGAYLFFTEEKKYKKALLLVGGIVIMLCPNLFHTVLLTCKNIIPYIIHNPVDLFGDANGAVIGLVFGLLATAAVFLAQSSRRTLSVIGTTLALLLVSGSLYLGVRFLNPESKIHQVYAHTKTENRFYFWEIARKAGNERPLFGYGYDNYEYVYQKSFDGTVFKSGYAPEKWVDRPHNALFEYFALTGYLGLVSYLSLFVFVVIATYNLGSQGGKNKYLSPFLVGLLVAYFVQNLFVFDTVIPLLVYFFVISISFAGAKEISISSSLNKKVLENNYVVISSMVILAVALVPLVILPVKESRAWYRVATQVVLSDYAKHRSGIEKISWVGDNNDKSYAAQLFSNILVRSLDKMNDSNKKYFYDSMSTTYDVVKSELEKTPDDFRLNYTAGRVAHILALISKGNSKIVSSEEKELLEESSSYITKALDLNSYYPDIHIEYSQVLALLGKKSESKKALDSARNLSHSEVSSYEKKTAVKQDVESSGEEVSKVSKIGSWGRSKECVEFKK